MKLEGDTSVIDALKEKKRCMDAGEPHEHIRPLLIVGAGLMKGVYGAGAMMTLEELGYTRTFSVAVGISSGAPTLAYFLAGQAQLLPKLIAEDIASSKLIRPWHIRNVVNLKYFIEVLQGRTGRGLDFMALQNNQTQFSIGVSEYKTAHPVFFTPTSKDTLMDCMRATVAIPGVVTKKVMIDGVRYVDGASTQPYVLDVVCERTNATHILAIMNQDREANHSPRSEKIVSTTIWRHRFSPALLKAANMRHRARIAFADKVLQGPIPTTVVWGDSQIGSYELSASALYTTAEASRQWWLKLLQE